MNYKKALSLFAFAAPVACFAGPTGLIAIPIADCLGHREFTYGFTAYGNEQNVNKGYAWSHCFQAGLGDSFEYGWDNDTMGNTVFNGKLNLYSTPKTGKFAVSAGIMNVNPIGERVDKYVMTRYDLKECRLHAGYLYTDIAHLAFGVDAPVKNGWTFMADYVSGPHFYAWAGLGIPLPWKGLTLTVAAGLPAEHEDGIQHQIGLTYAGKL